MQTQSISENNVSNLFLGKLSKKATKMNKKIHEAFTASAKGLASRPALAVALSKHHAHNGVNVITLAKWRSSVTPTLELVKVGELYFFGYRACGELRPLDGKALKRFKIKQSIKKFLKKPIEFLTGAPYVNTI